MQWRASNIVAMESWQAKSPQWLTRLMIELQLTASLSKDIHNFVGMGCCWSDGGVVRSLTLPSLIWS
jgi:hypothetical protein